MYKYKAVLFDLDGTLLDTLEDIASSMNAVLAKQGFPTHKVDAYRHFVGEGLEKLVRRTLPKGKITDEILTFCVMDMRKTYKKRWATKTAPYKNVPQLLTHLSEKNIKLAVLSNKPDDFTKMMVRHYLEKWHFEFVRGAVNGVPKKPDPSEALAIAANMKLPPEEFLYLGDTDTDMKTANNAKMYAIGASWGFRTKEELKTNGAQVIIDDPLELLVFFNDE